jgi:hypothetical protein
VGGLAGSAALAARETATSASTSVAGGSEKNIADAYGTLPLAFVPVGQADPRVSYSAQRASASFYFNHGEAVFAFCKEERDQQSAQGPLNTRLLWSPVG